MANNPSIIVIGAGISGLGAAVRLIKRGLKNITILEAQNRIGGRINSVKFGGRVVDLGAQWCHGEDGNIVYQMVKGLNLLASSYNDYLDHTFYLSTGSVLSKNITDKLFSIAALLYEDEDFATKSKESFGRYFIRNFNKKVFEEFGEDKEIQNVSKLMIETFHKLFLCYDAAVSWFDVSTTGTFLFERCEGDQQLQWKNKGYKTLIDVLLGKIPDLSKPIDVEKKIHFNKEVNSVLWKTEKAGVLVKCTDGSHYQGDHVILTIPLGVLKQSSTLLFTPKLPYKIQNAIEGVGVGTTNKILLKFPTKWWPDGFKTLTLVWTEEDLKKIPEEFSYGPYEIGKHWLEDVLGFYVIDSHPNVLLAWIVGQGAQNVESLSDEIVKMGCMYLLHKFAGHVFTITEPDEVLRSNWKSNKYACGSYSHITLETENRGTCPADFVHPLVSKNNTPVVLFAGEHTHPKYFSTVHGALETGYREADRIADLYTRKNGSTDKTFLNSRL